MGIVKSWNEIRKAAPALASIFVMLCALAAHGAHLAPCGGDANAPFGISVAWIPGVGDAAKGTFRVLRNAAGEIGEVATFLQHQPVRVKSTNGFARKQVDDVAREFGIKGIERKEFRDYIERLKHLEGRGGAQNYTYKELQEIAREFKGE